MSKVKKRSISEIEWEVRNKQYREEELHLKFGQTMLNSCGCCCCCCYCYSTDTNTHTFERWLPPFLSSGSLCQRYFFSVMNAFSQSNRNGSLPPENSQKCTKRCHRIHVHIVSSNSGWSWIHDLGRYWLRLRQSTWIVYKYNKKCGWLSSA